MLRLPATHLRLLRDQCTLASQADERSAKMSKGGGGGKGGGRGGGAGGAPHPSRPRVTKSDLVSRCKLNR